MPRRPSPNPPGPGDQIRISFLLDRRREPELAYILDMERHGDRPRELLRLAQIGFQAEVEMREIARAARQAGLASLSQFMPHAPEPGPSQEAPKSRQATRKEAANERRAEQTADQSDPPEVVIPEVVSPSLKARPAAPAAAPASSKNDEEPDDVPKPKVSGLGSFLA